MTFGKWFLNHVGITFEEAKQRGVWDLSVLLACWQAATLAERERAARVADQLAFDAAKVAEILAPLPKIPNYSESNAYMKVAAAIRKGEGV